MGVEIHTADVVEWCNAYEGPLMHAALLDPPYELNFMSKAWDNQGVAFDPDTWRAVSRVLHPGAFMFVFASSRGWHRLAVALEDAGFVTHPSVFMYGWSVGSGFPKATRIKDAPDFEGHRYGRQAMKPALEPILCVQKPYQGKARDSITATGAGALWVDGGRVATGDIWSRPGGPKAGASGGIMGKSVPRGPSTSTAGRWPPNLVLCHAPGCRRVGTRRVPPSGGGHYGGDSRQRASGFAMTTGATGDRLETVAAWDCAPECPVRRLGEQSGERDSGGPARRDYPGQSIRSNIPLSPQGEGIRTVRGHPDTGTAARFFPNPDYSLDIAEAIAAADPVMYCAKASRRERNAGCEGMPERMPDNAIDRASQRAGLEGAPGRGSLSKPRANPHPTVKPLALARWLATLLLPPAAYAPRRILIPFAGSGSEMIGAMLAGWEDVVGIEREAEYVAIAEARLAWWDANRDKAPEVRAGSDATYTHDAARLKTRPAVSNNGGVYANGRATATPPMLPGLATIEGGGK